MAREFEEEAGVLILYDCWEEFARVSGIVEGDKWKVHFMRSFNIDLSQVKTMEEESVEVCRIHQLPSMVIPNLRWLIPLALDMHVNIPVIVEETNR